MPCLLATTPRGGPRAPLADTLAVLREAAREAGVVLIFVTDGPIGKHGSRDGARIMLSDEDR